jgi:hypothetical protein
MLAPSSSWVTVRLKTVNQDGQLLKRNYPSDPLQNSPVLPSLFFLSSQSCSASKDHSTRPAFATIYRLSLNNPPFAILHTLTYSSSKIIIILFVLLSPFLFPIARIRSQSCSRGGDIVGYDELCFRGGHKIISVTHPHLNIHNHCTVEGGKTIGTTALVYWQLHSSLYMYRCSTGLLEYT